MKTLLSVLLVLAAGVVALAHATDGFRAFTTEDGRRLSVRQHPRALPPVTVQYESGAPVSLAQSLREDGRVAIAVFVYTRCNAVCSAVGSEFQQMQQTLRARGLDRKVRLLSITFDPRDDQPQLARYAARMRTDAATWRLARVPDPAQLDLLLRTFGITVIPAPLGEFEHNAAFHLLTPDGRLVRIIDYDRPDAALAYAASLADRTSPRGRSPRAAGAAS